MRQYVLVETKFAFACAAVELKFSRDSLHFKIRNFSVYCLIPDEWDVFVVGVVVNPLRSLLLYP
jgi:hypothetical protein